MSDDPSTVPAGPDAPTATAQQVPVADLGIAGLVAGAVVGRGGSGTVYRAAQAELNRTVAVKVLSAALDPVGLERFRREGFAMGTVSGHPQIVTVFAVGTTAEGRPYLLMPFLEGGSLAQLLPLSWPDAVSHAIKLCGALETAHRAGVLHRDVKPANVLISTFGEPQLADFGISRVSGGFETSEGLISASIAYAAPEILNGRPATPTSDVYSLAATVFCAVAGTPPFAAGPDEDLLATCLRIARDPVPDLRSRGVPDPVCAAIEAALSKDPADRPQSAADFGRQLQEAQRATGRPVTGMVLTVAPTADPDTTVAAVRALSSATGPTEQTLAVPERELTATPALAAPTPTLIDSRTLVDRPPDLDSPATEVNRPAPGRTRRLTAVIAILAVLLVAVAAGIIFWPRSEIATITGPGVQRADLGTPSGIAIAADGTVFIADSEKHRVQRVSTDGTIDTYLGTGQPGDSGNGGPATAATISFPSAIALAPDGTLYVAENGLIRSVDPAGVAHSVAGFADHYGIVALAMHSDGSLFAAQRTLVYVRRTDGTVSLVAGDQSEFGYIESLAIAPDGSLAVSDSGRYQVLRVDAAGAVTRIAGLGTDVGEPKDDGHLATQTALAGPVGITFDTAGSLYISEGGMNRVRKLLTNGTLVTVAGSPDGYSAGFTGDGAQATQATFTLYTGPLAVGADGALYIGDAKNHRVRQIAADGVVRTFA